MLESRTTERQNGTDLDKAKKPKTVRQLAKMFLTWVKGHRSENTWKMYSNRLKPFKRQFGDRRIKSLKRFEIEDYLDAVNKWPDGRDKAPDTIRANIVALEQLEKFGLKRELVKRRFIWDHEKPVGRRRERLPTPEEVEQIKSIATKEFKLVYQALRQSGARPNEIARASVENWNRADNMIVLEKHKTSRKTGKPRKIFVGANFQELILESLGDRTEGPLFVTPGGRAWTTDTLSQTFSRYRNRMKIDKKVVLYTARHEFGTASAQAIGTDITSELMGHSSTSMTQHYVHRKPELLRAKQDEVNL